METATGITITIKIVGINKAEIIIQKIKCVGIPVDTNCEIKARKVNPKIAISISIIIKILIKLKFFFTKYPPINAPIANPNKKEAKTIDKETSVAPTTVVTTDIKTTSYNKLAKPVENIIKNIIILLLENPLFRILTYVIIT